MAKQKLPSKQNIEIRLREALEIERVRREELSRRFPEVPFAWPPWPHLEGDSLSVECSKELGSEEDSISDIQWRLQEFYYPYELGPKNSKSFYEWAKSRGVLNVLISPPLLWEIRRFWWNQLHDSRLAKLGKKSIYGYPLAFHRGILHQLVVHLDHIEKFATKYHVPLEWLGKYRAAVLEQLLHEGAIYYPEAQFHLVPANQLPTPLRKIKAQIVLFNKLYLVLKENGLDSRKFAYQLTALFCSSREHIKKHHELVPTPLAVRRNVETYKAKIGETA
jgi:hypothetical protein